MLNFQKKLDIWLHLKKNNKTGINMILNVQTLGKILIIILAAFYSLYASALIEKCDAQEADRWKYLWQNPSLETRQLISAGFIIENNIKTVIEIGGYCTPICRYLPNIKYINIDPFVNSNPKICTNATLIKKGFEKLHVKDLDIEKPFALVALGIFWENMKDEKNIEENAFLNEAIKEASVVIAESTYPVSWVRNQSKIIETLSEKYGLKKRIDINIDVQGPRPMNNVFYRHMSLMSR